MLRRIGPLQGVLKMIPGLGKQLEGIDQVDENQLKRVEGIILSMTPHERRVPHVIDASRRTRIAAGSGTTLEQVNQLIEARKQMAKMMKMAGSGKMPQIPGVGMTGNGLAGHQLGQGPPRPSATRKSKSSMQIPPNLSARFEILRALTGWPSCRNLAADSSLQANQTP